jgi:hypothetical protein
MGGVELLSQVVGVVAGTAANASSGLGLNATGAMMLGDGGGSTPLVSNASTAAAAAAEKILCHLAGGGLGSEVVGVQVPGLAVVPASVRVGIMEVEEFIGVLAGFTVAGWLAVLVATVVAVKLRLT